MSTLSHATLAQLVGNLKQAKQIDVHERELKEIEDLSVCPLLSRIDVSHNKLTSLEFLKDNGDVSNLSAHHNEIEDINCLDSLTKLRVLNIGHNQFTRIPSLPSLVNLNALIANENQISGAISVSCWSALNTLVLSHNKITEVRGLKSLEHLKKLSLSGNLLREFPDISGNVHLKELRLCHNKICVIPENLGLLFRLNILEVSHNLIVDIRCLDVLQNLKRLGTLNISGNPICTHASIQEKLKTVASRVKRLDASPRDGKKSTKLEETETHSPEQRKSSQKKQKQSQPLQTESQQTVSKGKSITIPNPQPSRKQSLDTSKKQTTKKSSDVSGSKKSKVVALPEVPSDVETEQVDRDEVTPPVPSSPSDAPPSPTVSRKRVRDQSGVRKVRNGTATTNKKMKALTPFTGEEISKVDQWD